MKSRVEIMERIIVCSDTGGGGIFDGSRSGAKVTPPTKGLGIIVTPVRRYIGEKKHVHPRGKHRLCKR